MDEVRHFLENATVHGFQYISSTRRFSKLFWIIVVFCGFSGAIFLIEESFFYWKQNPISTTLESLPISELTLPKVRVCPPKDSTLTLNYNLIQAEKIYLDKDKRKELSNMASDIIQESYFFEIMKNVSKLNEENRFFNWYHGITKIKLPYHFQPYNQLSYGIETSALHGSISTEYFGESFDLHKVDRNVYYHIILSSPQMANLTVNIEKVNIKELSDTDKLDIFSDAENFNQVYLNFKNNYDQFYLNFTDTLVNKTKTPIYVNRKISTKELSQLKTEVMPGFKLKWNLDIEVEDDNFSPYKNDSTTIEFVK